MDPGYSDAVWGVFSRLNPIPSRDLSSYYPFKWSWTEVSLFLTQSQKDVSKKKKHLRLGKQPYIFPRVFPWAFLGYPGTLINNSKTSSPSLDFTYAPTPLTLALAWPLSGPVGIGETRHGWVSNLRAGRHHLISALLEISWTSWMHTCHLSLAMFCWRRLRRQPKSTKPLSGFDWLV